MGLTSLSAEPRLRHCPSSTLPIPTQLSATGISLSRTARSTRVHDAKGNTKVRLGKTGSDGMPGKLAPSSSYFFDNPERKEITCISGNPFRFTGVSNPDMIGMLSRAKSGVSGIGEPKETSNT
jgi:hypothetical protein